MKSTTNEQNDLFILRNLTTCQTNKMPLVSRDDGRWQSEFLYINALHIMLQQRQQRVATCNSAAAPAATAVCNFAISRTHKECTKQHTIK